MYAEMDSLRCCKHAGECISENLLTSFKTTSPPFCGAAKEDLIPISSSYSILLIPFILDLIILIFGKFKRIPFQL